MTNSTSGEITCRVCGGPIPKVQGRGRPRTYCSVGCRRKVEFARRRVRDRWEYDPPPWAKPVRESAPLARRAMLAQDLGRPDAEALGHEWGRLLILAGYDPDGGGWNPQRGSDQQ